MSEAKGPWHTETIEIDEPHAYEVRVKMAFAGMCHSDEHLRRGSMVPEASVLELMTGRDTAYPVIGGHEGSGVVESVGDGVTAVEPGDHVAMSFIPSCGSASTARRGGRILCDIGAYTLVGPMISDGTWRHHLGDQELNRMCQLGTFSEYMVVHEASVIRIEPWYDLRAAALISCGISTGFGCGGDPRWREARRHGRRHRLRGRRLGRHPRGAARRGPRRGRDRHRISPRSSAR